MQNRVDVHILHMPNENPVWWEICKNSLANEPVNIYNVMGTYGDLRDSRTRGFNEGTAEYVSFVDPDDSIIPGVFEKCIAALDANPGICGVYTLSNIIKWVNGKDVITSQIHPYRPWKRARSPMLLEIHQLVVMRRELLIPTINEHYLNIPKMLPTELWMYWALAQRAPWLALDLVGYNWRDNPYGVHHSKTPEITADIDRTYKFIKKSW